MHFDQGPAGPRKLFEIRGVVWKRDAGEVDAEEIRVAGTVGTGAYQGYVLSVEPVPHCLARITQETSLSPSYVGKSSIQRSIKKRFQTNSV